MNTKKLLLECGYTENQARTYLALLTSGSAPLSVVSRVSGIKRTSLYNFIDEMIERGLVHKVQRGKRWYYQAASPDSLISRQRDKLLALEDAAPTLREVATNAPKPAKVTYLEGATEMKSIVEEEINCAKEALYIWPAKDVVPTLGGVRYLTAMDKKRIAKGISVKSIHFKDKRVYLETGAASPKNLREVRFAPKDMKATMGVGIYDNGKVGFFSSKGESFGVLIESKEITELMRYLFRSLWERSEK